jgi:hypothetical protein
MGHRGLGFWSERRSNLRTYTAINRLLGFEARASLQLNSSCWKSSTASRGRQYSGFS